MTRRALCGVLVGRGGLLLGLRALRGFRGGLGRRGSFWDRFLAASGIPGGAHVTGDVADRFAFCSYPQLNRFSRTRMMLSAMVCTFLFEQL